MRSNQKWAICVIHSASHKFWDCASKTTKKISKNSKQIFLFNVSASNCNTLIGAIFQLMHCSQKISNKNSLQFYHYICLNVAYGCIAVPLQLHFLLWKRKIVGWTQIRKVPGMVKYFAWTVCCSRCSAVNACGTNRAHSFRFFKSSDRMQRTMVFGIVQLAWQSFKTPATRAMCDVFVVPSLLLCSASSIDSSPAANCLYHRKHFFKHFTLFRSRKFRFTTKFYCGTLFKFFL